MSVFGKKKDFLTNLSNGSSLVLFAELFMLTVSCILKSYGCESPDKRYLLRTVRIKERHMNVDAQFILVETTLIPSYIYSSIVNSLQADHTSVSLPTKHHAWLLHNAISKAQHLRTKLCALQVVLGILSYLVPPEFHCSSARL